MKPRRRSTLSARLVEQIGFEVAYVGGYVTGASRAITEPLLTMTEQANVAGECAQSVDIPVLADAGAGFGEPLHARPARHSRLGKIWRECGSEFWVILEILSGRRSCSPESSCCDLDIPPTTGSEAVRRVGILMGGPGSGRPKSRHRTVESCLALDADCDSVALGFVVDSTMIQFKPQ